MLEYNARVVAGITPGKEGMKVHDIPIYDTVAQAKKEYSIYASMIVVPPSGVLAAALDAIENGIPLVVIITEFVPFHDTLKIRAFASRKGVRLVGPNTIGVISPGKSKVGIMPGFIYGEGHVGIISRSGTSPMKLPPISPIEGRAIYLCLYRRGYGKGNGLRGLLEIVPG
jgi:succinyl-CoA synthetase alpha subunit